MKQLTKFIESNIAGKKVLALFILTNAAYLFMLLVTIPKTMEFSEGMKLLDMMPTGYDWNYVNTLFGTLGTDGRETYLTNQIPVDMIYPFLFAISYCLLLGYFLNKLGKLKPPFIYLCLLPIIAGIFDYMENVGIITMLKSYPDLPEVATNTSNIFTIIKSISTSLFFIALFMALISLGLRMIAESRTKG